MGARRRFAFGVAVAAGAAVLAGFALPAAADAAVARFQPAADSYVTVAKRNVNFGRSGTLLVDGAPVTRAYVRFNVQGVAGSLRNVTLELTARNRSTSGLSVRRASGNGWSERTIRYTNAPGMTGPAASSGQVRAGRVRIDVSSLVRGNGLVTLVLTTRGRAAISLVSREGAAASRPALVVTSNSAPTCAPTTLAIDEDAVGTTAPACSDPDGDALTYAIVGQGTKGTASVAGASLRYAPSPNANGADSFTYHARDASGAGAPATVSVAVRPVNDAPVCQNRTLSTTEDTPGSVAPSCTDIDSDPLTYAASGGAKGTPSVVGGELRYVPNPNANGSDSFRYLASDGTLQSPEATTSVTITPVNDLPTCQARSLQTNEDTPGSVDVTCSDVENDQLTYEIASPASSGMAVVNGTQLHYTPNANANGTDAFAYRAKDAGGAGAPAPVSVTVTGVNDPPSASADTGFTVLEDHTLQFPADQLVGNDSAGPANESGQALTVTGVSASPDTRGSVELSQDPLMITYRPAANYSGPTSFDYTVCDPSLCAKAQVSVSVMPVNDAPTCQNRSLETVEDTAKTVAPSCTDIDGDTLTHAIAGQGTKGTASVVGGALHYQPNPDATGDDAFTYRASDGTEVSAPATVSVTIGGTDDLPTCSNLSLGTSEEVAASIAPSCSDPEGQALSFRIAAAPGKGFAMMNDAGDRLVYDPTANQHGADSFTYQASDDGGTRWGPAATVTVSIASVNDVPEAAPQSVTTSEDAAKSLTLLAEDFDGQAMTFRIETLPANGALHVGASAAGARIDTVPHVLPGDTVTYAPLPGFSGGDGFQFTASDGEARSDPADVAITVQAVNRPPVCTDSSVELNEDEDFSGTVCDDPDGDELTFESTGPSHGTLDLFEDGSFSYVPDANYNGPDSFAVTATDPDGASSDEATVSITVKPMPEVNTRPTCEDVAILTVEDDNGTQVPDCTDADGEALTYEVVTQPAKGTARFEDGELLFVPNPNANGADSFTYRASDGELQSLAATVDVTIDPVNDPPIANLDESDTVLDGASVDINARLNDFAGPPTADDEVPPAPSQTLTVTAVTDPATGTASVVAGRVRYTPDEGALGDVFQYTVCDNGTPSKCATGTISVTVVHGALPTIETDPVGHSGDAADDPAIWVHPTDPSQSTVIGTDKLGGISVYDLAGHQIQALDPLRRMNNVDLRDGFPLPDQPEPVTLVVASDRTGGSWRLNLYRVEPVTRMLVSVRSVPMTFEPYGLCLYESPTSDKLYVFANEEDSAVGRMEQWELAPDATATGGVKATKIRQWNVGSEAEGCVADDELGHLYVAEEDVGIWKYGAEPGAGTTRTQVDSVDYASGHVRQDVEGLAIVYGSGGTGYLLASSQGNESFAVYRREGGNTWLRNVRLDANFDVDPVVDGVTETDGIDVTAANLGPAFPNGLFVVQDGTNTLFPSGSANQNYKFTPLDKLLEGIPAPPPF